MVHGLTLSPKKLLHLRALIRSLPISLIADRNTKGCIELKKKYSFADINQSPSCN
jgi:hypothetical protein